MHVRSGFRHVPGVGVLALAFASALVAAATREIALKQPPFWTRDSTYVAANVGLVLIVVLQMMRGMQQRRKKFKVVREAAEQAPAATPTPRVATAPPPSRAAAPPAPAPAASQVVRCGSCTQPLKLAAAPRPLRFKCPKCQTVGVAN